MERYCKDCKTIAKPGCDTHACISTICQHCEKPAVELCDKCLACQVCWVYDHARKTEGCNGQASDVINIWQAAHASLEEAAQRVGPAEKEATELKQQLQAAEERVADLAKRVTAEATENAAAAEAERVAAEAATRASEAEQQTVEANQKAEAAVAAMAAAQQETVEAERKAAEAERRAEEAEQRIAGSPEPSSGITIDNFQVGSVIQCCLTKSGTYVAWRPVQKHPLFILSEDVVHTLELLTDPTSKVKPILLSIASLSEKIQEGKKWPRLTNGTPYMEVVAWPV